MATVLLIEDDDRIRLSLTMALEPGRSRRRRRA
jgi:hypothetical protein